VVKRPVNQNPPNCRVIFAGRTPAWNLRAREIAVVWLNPPSWRSASALHPIRVNREPALRAGTLARAGAVSAGRAAPNMNNQDRIPTTKSYDSKITRPSD